MTGELKAYLAAARRVPFAWGTHDCYTFARDWIEQRTGKRVEVSYTDAMSAARFIAEQGGMLNAVTNALGSPLERPQTARRGDVALVVIEERQCLGIVDGEHVFGPGENGLMAVARKQIIAAWRV